MRHTFVIETHRVLKLGRRQAWRAVAERVSSREGATLVEGQRPLRLRAYGATRREASEEARRAVDAWVQRQRELRAAREVETYEVEV